MPGEPLLNESSEDASRLLDAALIDLVNEHGADSVRAATARVVRKSPGRKAENDWRTLHPLLIEEAQALLDGSGPVRSNTQLAAYAATFASDAYRTSTLRRVMKKLSQERREITLIYAALLARATRPYDEALSVLNKLALENPASSAWAQQETESIRRNLARHRIRTGEPNPELTSNDLKKVVSELPIGGIGSGILEERLVAKS